MKLAGSFSGIPVLLEARMDDSELKPNVLPERFFLPDVVPANDKTISGQSGWIPLPVFATEAQAIGFVDFVRPEKVPMLEKYQGKFVKSLYLCALEMAWDRKAQVLPGRRVIINGKSLGMDEQNQVPIEFHSKDALDYIPFHKLLAEGDEVRTLENKIVIVGYDGEKMHSIDTPAGKIKAHRLFCYALAIVWNKTEN